MTAPRQQPSPVLGAIVALFLCGIKLPALAQAAIAGPVVVNPATGIAISGFDPVAYFTDRKAVSGKAEFETTISGTIWRFDNEGNRAAFIAHPEVYAPRFGGYDPVAIARNRSVPGHPQFWVLAGERLYLFYSAEARAAFLADPGRAIDAAERKWPEVARALGQ